jgi:FtsP/CotA-like multicopper oxidase with cupredoxin domain
MDMSAETNRKMTKKNQLLTSAFGLAIILLMGMMVTPIVTQAQMNMGTSSTNSDPMSQLRALQQQEAQLRAQIQQTQTQVEQHHKDTFSTMGLAKPTLSASDYDKIKHCNPNQSMPAINSSAFFNWWKTYLTDFHCGHVTKVFPVNNTAEREFTLIADDNQGFGHYIKISKNVSDPVLFPSWGFNNTVPAPTLRVTQGDHVKITIVNSKNSKFAHSFHMHSIHSGENDGMTGAAGSIPPGQSFTYEFIARPFGVYPFHCHMEPVQQHIQRGLYGMLIIDPPKPRLPAHEMVMIMNGFSFNQINLVHPNNNPQPLLLPPTAAALRNATQDFGILQTAQGASEELGAQMVDNVMNEKHDDNNDDADAAPSPPTHHHHTTPSSSSSSPQPVTTTTPPSQPPTPTPLTTPTVVPPLNLVQVSDDNSKSDNNGNSNNNDKQQQQQGEAADTASQAADAAKEAAQEQKDAALEPGGGEAGNDNQFYAVNSMAFGYTLKDMIPLKTNTTYRIYLVNMVEFDPMNSFHLHGGLFQYYPSGTSMKPAYTNDIILLGQGDRGIVEFKFNLPGDFMVHAHINRFTNLGWLAMFHVTTTGSKVLITPPPSASAAPTTPSLAPQIPRVNNTAIPFLNVALQTQQQQPPWNSTKPWPHQLQAMSK